MKKYRKEFVIGISVIIAGLILFFGIDYLKGINLLNPTNYYYVECDDVSGLDLSAPVTINGYKVGQVRNISYDYEKGGKIKVLLAVNDKLRLPEGSYAEKASTLISGDYVNIHLGNGKGTIPSGGVIPISATKGMMDAISQDVMPAINTILPRVDSLLLNLNNLVADPALAGSIQRLDGITGNVLTLTQGLNATANKDVPRIMRNARNITTKLDSVSYNLMALSAALKELPLASTMDNVNVITENLTHFSRQLNNPNSTLGQLTNDPELYNRINRVAADVDSLIVDIKKNPKRYISIKLL